MNMIFILFLAKGQFFTCPDNGLTVFYVINKGAYSTKEALGIQGHQWISHTTDHT